MDHKPLQHNAAPHGDFSVGAGAGDNRNIAAQAGDAAARAVENKHKRDAAKNQAVDPQVLERIVAEEREAKGKLPKYPGLERWQLVEKMGDGAFSNVYRARDTTGQWDEVAIKVVRKFEMNSQQVSITLIPALPCTSPCVIITPFLPHHERVTVWRFGRYQREAGDRTSMCIRTSRLPKQLRCDNITPDARHSHPFPIHFHPRLVFAGQTLTAL
jgi:hypothetical protein